MLRLSQKIKLGSCSKSVRSFSGSVILIYLSMTSYTNNILIQFCKENYIGLLNKSDVAFVGTIKLKTQDIHEVNRLKKLMQDSSKNDICMNVQWLTDKDTVQI